MVASVASEGDRKGVEQGIQVTDPTPRVPHGPDPDPPASFHTRSHVPVANPLARELASVVVFAMEETEALRPVLLAKSTAAFLRDMMMTGMGKRSAIFVQN
jgi:hypothetical protein